MTNMNNLTNELLNNAPATETTPETPVETPATPKPITFTYTATIDSFNFAKDTAKPYVSFTPRDENKSYYADIHPALAFRAAGQQFSPIATMLNAKMTVKVVLKVVDGKKQYKMISPYPSNAQITAYRLYLKRKQDEKREATEEEVKLADF